MYLLDGYSKIEAYDLIQKVDYSSYSNESLEKYNRILKGNIKKCPLDDISSSGYVVDTLEASLWCLLVHDNYEDTILEAINLGNDTDTVAAITGSMAGIVYGINAIPKEWLNTLIKKDYIIDLSLEFERKIK
jgi:ADP-ribosylglycohydrolase